MSPEPSVKRNYSPLARSVTSALHRDGATTEQRQGYELWNLPVYREAIILLDMVGRGGYKWRVNYGSSRIVGGLKGGLETGAQLREEASRKHVVAADDSGVCCGNTARSVSSELAPSNSAPAKRTQIVWAQFHL